MYLRKKFLCAFFVVGEFRPTVLWWFPRAQGNYSTLTIRCNITIRPVGVIKDLFALVSPEGARQNN